MNLTPEDQAKLLNNVLPAMVNLAEAVQDLAEIVEALCSENSTLQTWYR